MRGMEKSEKMGAAIWTFICARKVPRPRLRKRCGVEKEASCA